MSEQERTRKMCKCGRAPIFTGRWAKYNAKDDDSKQVCAECAVERIYDKFLKDAK
jgi:hypothetical protein